MMFFKTTGNLSKWVGTIQIIIPWNTEWRIWKESSNQRNGDRKKTYVEFLAKEIDGRKVEKNRRR